VSRLFIDTSAFVALRNSGEREHEAARSALEDLVAQRVPLFTSSYVFSETYTALLVRVGRSEAITWGRQMRAGTAIEIVTIDDDVADGAWQLLEEHADKPWSHVDATSFALMDREHATTALAFDRHFEQRGLQVVPGAQR
jgi:predicted nucleic acid-binding protein